MATERSFRVTDFSALSSPMQQQAVLMLVDAFYQHRTDIPHQEAIQKLDTMLHTQQERAFCVTDANTVLGISTYLVYDYSRLKDQLYMETAYEDGHLSAFRLTRFHDLLEKKQMTQGLLPKVAGFGYSFVLPEFRRQGIAKCLFRRRMEAIEAHEDVGVIFAIIRGPYAPLNISQAVLSSLLEAEEQANGRENEQRVKITGIWKPCAHFEQMLQLPVRTLNNYSGSPAMTKLIADGNFVPLGFFRSLSPVWATTRARWQQQERR